MESRLLTTNSMLRALQHLTLGYIVARAAEEKSFRIKTIHYLLKITINTLPDKA